MVYTNIDQRGGWGYCNTLGCSGGSGNGTYWMAQNQSAPSLDGNSMEIYNDGIWSDALWWQKMGKNNTATNFLWDFYAQVDNASVGAVQALEYDAFQFIGGYNYMMGTQCNVAAKVWDVWDELNGHWIHTSIPCTKFDPNVWHHIQLYTTRDPNSHNYTFVTLVVDGTSYSINRTYSALYLGWGDDVGVQYQLDVNATGTGYHEWIDSSKLTIW
jgi:hypothetical protein